jgi:hypothetical protein
VAHIDPVSRIAGDEKRRVGPTDDAMGLVAQVHIDTDCYVNEGREGPEIVKVGFGFLVQVALAEHVEKSGMAISCGDHVVGAELAPVLQLDTDRLAFFNQNSFHPAVVADLPTQREVTRRNPPGKCEDPPRGYPAARLFIRAKQKAPNIGKSGRSKTERKLAQEGV